MVAANPVGTTFWAITIVGIKEGSLDGEGRGASGKIGERFEYDWVAKSSERVQFKSGVWDIRLQDMTVEISGVQQGGELIGDTS